MIVAVSKLRRKYFVTGRFIPTRTKFYSTKDDSFVYENGEVLNYSNKGVRHTGREILHLNGMYLYFHDSDLTLITEKGAYMIENSEGSTLYIGVYGKRFFLYNKNGVFMEIGNNFGYKPYRLMDKHIPLRNIDMYSNGEKDIVVKALPYRATNGVFCPV